MSNTTPDNYTFDFEPIRGYPELRWTGKRPFKGTMYFPAQLKETHGDTVDGWRNKIYWGDNLQVMSHLLKEFRGKVKLVYIDPPFDSKADYKKKIELRGKSAESDASAFEEKQYTDIWTNDEYLQFMYERLILLRELLADDGSIYVHCDWHKNHYIRLLLDEIFGNKNFLNDIIWQRTGAHNDAEKFGIIHDQVLWFSKTQHHIFNPIFVKHTDDHINSRFNQIDEKNGKPFFPGPITAPGDGPPRIFAGKTINPPIGRHWSYSQENIDQLVKNNLIYFSKTGTPYLKQYMEEYLEQGRRVQSLWLDLLPSKTGNELLGYPTQKPETLLERIISASSNPGDIVFDCFMGSGTTQAVATKLGRRFLGADINLGAVQTTTKRLLNITKELEANTAEGDLFAGEAAEKKYTGFEVYTVNHYDFFRNELEAKELLIEALEVQKLPGNMLWDGEKDGWKIKILAVNRLATAADLNPVISNIDFKSWEKKAKEYVNEPVEKIRFVCMGHDPDLKAQFLQEMEKYHFKVDVEVSDILRDKKELQFKRQTEADIMVVNGELLVAQFYPMNLLQKLSVEKTAVANWRELVDSILIDWNYDGAVFTPTESDIPNKNSLVTGVYQMPKNAGTIRVKITDLLSESWEGNVEV